MHSSELEVTWKRVFPIWLSYLWRNIIAIICATIISFIVSYLIGSVMTYFGFKTSFINLVTRVTGFLIGITISIIPLKMVIGKNFGNFRLTLVTNNIEQNKQ